MSGMLLNGDGDVIIDGQFEGATFVFGQSPPMAFLVHHLGVNATFRPLRYHNLEREGHPKGLEGECLPPWKAEAL